MDRRGNPQHDRPRAPLGDATERVINSTARRDQSHKQPKSDVNPLLSNPVPVDDGRESTLRVEKATQAPSSAPASKRASAASGQEEDTDKRVSQISTSSGASSSKRKTHIGPWQLGKTLGKGSAGRVRLARHYVTFEQVAVKILPKNQGQLTQAGSLAALDEWDRGQPEFVADNRMPLAIEREVAILKLIDHPNIVKLYDIWENRSEIYLVLEYVENGDLFEYINYAGPLQEDEAVFYFRQILSALDYCHSFNICHRDLKPENILLTNNCQIKIADFGMAAIQQSPNHKLKTACGSPHYAAPELVSRKKGGYRGDKVDIWSAGVILYACLCARLPFDDPDYTVLLAKASRGKYEEPEWLSRDARDLIRQMLQVDPSNRITIRQIWKHDFIVRYDYLDELNGKRHGDELDIIRKHGCNTRLKPEDIDMQTLRQLKSMWHTFTEKELALKLISDESNDQKLFYWLLYSYREKQLENYAGDLTYSPSDYHHLRPANWKKKFTTLEFPAQFGRAPSRFTVISTVAADPETATDACTSLSYDPYKASRNMDCNADPSHAKITVHRDGSVAKSSTRTTNTGHVRGGSIKSTSTYSQRGARNRYNGAPAALKSSRRSMTSIRSTESTPYKRPVSRHKRGVNFSHVRQSSIRQQSPSIAGDDTSFDRDVTSPASPFSRPQTSRGLGRPREGVQSMVDPVRREHGRINNDEMSYFSYSIAKDCDEAFNSPLLAPESYFSDPSIETPLLDSSMAEMAPAARSLSVAIGASTPGSHVAKPKKHESHPWDTRPLPPAPPPTDSVLHEIMLAKRRSERDERRIDEIPSHVDRLLSELQAGHPPFLSPERRVVSAPIYSQYSTLRDQDTLALPSIFESHKEVPLGEQKKRNSSAPTGEKRQADHTALEYLSRQEETIRLVQSPSQQSPVRAPAPLNVRKKLSRGTSAYPQARQETRLREQYLQDEIREQAIPEEPSAASSQRNSQRSSRRSSSGPSKKKSMWFKRGSKESKDGALNSRVGSTSSRHSERTQSYSESNSSSTVRPMPPTKKKSFSFAFWRSNGKEREDPKLSIGGPELDDSPSPEPIKKLNHPSQKTKQSVAQRHIDPHQNWLARLFRVKPATEYLCFTISRRRARQEIAILLKEWRRYGIRDVQVDKDRNIVFGRVGSKNYLNMKEVAFAAEIMTVIEHGKRTPLSIVRFTQERGAASSFHKVLDTVQTVFSVRGLLVVDKRKTKMMIRTLNS